MATHFSPKIVTSGLVLHLDAGNKMSYPGSGTVWTDLSGNGNTGTLTNSPTFSMVGGGAVVLDGTNDFIDLSATGINVSNSFTYQCWVYFTNIGAYSGGTWNRETLISNSYPYSANTGFWFGATSQKAPGNEPTAGYERLFISIGNDQRGALSSNGSLSINRWYNISARVNNTDLIKLYINGIETTYEVQSNCDISITYNTNCYIGRRDSTTDHFNGNFAMAQLYNRALSDAEVLQNFNATKGRYGL